MINFLTKQTHIVPDKIDSPIRIQEYGVGIFEDYPTKSGWKKALKRKLVRVDAKIACSATILNGGEQITLINSTEITDNKRLDLNLHVVYQDDYLAVVRKPAGILVSGNRFKTVANALVSNLSPSKIGDATTPQPVHRLDYATTGLLMVGKTRESIQRLNKMFEQREIAKTYVAITIGLMDAQGKIDKLINGKPAVSSYTVLQTVNSKRFGQLNLVELMPESGRRHQLRIHMAQHGTPILGDRDYSNEKVLLKGKGMYLHAKSLKFIHPFTKAPLTITDELPKRFQKIFPKAQ